MQTVHYVSVLVLRPVAGSFELLLGRRADGRYMGGTWQLVTGGIEPGETAWAAALREIGEETALPVRAFYRLSTTQQFYRADADALCVAPMFCAITDAGAEPAMNAEHTAFAWHPLADASGRLMWPGDRDALAEVVREIVNDGPAKPYLKISLGERPPVPSPGMAGRG